ncbi:MAG TPA: carboxypeptidase-like regulatory domain-containing protein [Pyrinomonadaceae bacterium]|nr:carboxypeptidase-like regulatory domain-containing protein [Pyrinomonadaceae bacterium]
MKKGTKSTLFIWTALAFIILSSQIRASCPIMMQQPPCFEFWRTDAVFIAMAIEVQQKPSNWDISFSPPPLIVRLKIEESFKGIEEKEVTIDMNDCGYQFKQGEKYLVYARRNPNDKKLYVRIGGTRTQLLAEATEDLNYIRSVLRGEPQPKIIGTVGETSTNVKLNQSIRLSSFLDNFLKPIFYGKPSPNVKVIAERDGEIYETFTNGEGVYQFFDLPDGVFKIRPEFPPFFDVKEQTTTTKNQGCSVADLGAARKGGISGKILDADGMPIKGVPVSLVFADVTPQEILEQKSDENVWTTVHTDTKGEYSFKYLPAGSYHVIVNLNMFARSRGSKEAQKLPRLFYPGVKSLEEAVVITIEEGEKTEGVNIQLPKTNINVKTEK